ncbi:tetratricopeptide repeat protein [Streptomyces sp. NPDC052676]|uniref:tetratricopeptide repeat protein n=1 Tax=Streptomyces sp. NPDC052676 TaxID=3154953 RepID=UPI00341F1636
MTNPLAGLFRPRRKEAAGPALYARAVRECGEYLAARGDSSAAAHARLVRAVGVLAASLAPVGSPGAVPAGSGAASAGPDATSADPFDALLRTAERALEAGGEDGLGLALALTGTATEIRRRSKGAWRLRGLALDGLGRDAEALECYERHLALAGEGGGSAEVVRRVATLRRRRECVEAAVALFPEAGSPLLEPTAATTTATATTAATTARVAPEFAAFVRARVAQYGVGHPEVRRLLRLYGAYRRLVERDGPLLAGDGPDGPRPGGCAPIGVGGLRGLLAGRTVCLVANTEEVAASTLGPGIDRYDVVMRCDSFRLRAPGTGERTDVHAVSLRGATPWEGPAWTRPAGVRLVFGDPAAAWRRAVRQRLVPTAQEHIGDASLRRPLSDPALLGEDGWDGGTTTAFTLLRLLDFLDAGSSLDLIGFRSPGALRPREAEWVMDRATRVDDSKMRIALR